MSTNEAIRVVVRLRPAENSIVVVEDDKRGDSSTSQTLSLGNHRFGFDNVHPPAASTSELYANEVKKLVHASVEGYNTCVMCYGQTGSGKTHTVMGSLAR